VSKKIKKKAHVYEEEEPPAPPTQRSITRLSSEEHAQLGLPNSEDYIQEVLKTHRRKPVAQKLKIVVSQKDREIQRLQQQVQRLEDEKRQMMEVAQNPVVSSQPEPPIQMSNTHLTTGVERVVDRSTTGQSASQNQVALATAGAQPHTPDFEQPVDSGRRQGRSRSPQQRMSYRNTFSSDKYLDKYRPEEERGKKARHDYSPWAHPRDLTLQGAGSNRQVVPHKPLSHQVELTANCFPDP
jgi:hypothetical protein